MLRDPIYRPTISFHENHQPVQGWNPTTTIKTKILKMRFNDKPISVGEVGLLSEIAGTLVTKSYIVQYSVRI